jgi:hypothetical protein
VIPWEYRLFVWNNKALNHDGKEFVPLTPNSHS